jgi:hypothetical protein
MLKIKEAFITERLLLYKDDLISSESKNPPNHGSDKNCPAGAAFAEI